VSSRGKVTFSQYRVTRSGGTSVPSVVWYLTAGKGFAFGFTQCNSQPDEVNPAPNVKIPAWGLRKRGLGLFDVQQLFGANNANRGVTSAHTGARPFR
jgi:hypothetical protein